MRELGDFLDEHVHDIGRIHGRRHRHAHTMKRAKLIYLPAKRADGELLGFWHVNGSEYKGHDSTFTNAGGAKLNVGPD